MSKYPTRAIVIIAESGYLVQQARLFLESVNRISEFSSWKKLVYSPRQGFDLCAEDRWNLEKLGATVNAEDLNIEHDFLPHCNGIYACAHVENSLGPETILLADTDTIFSKQLPDEYLQTPGIWLRPVDNKGIGSTGESDVNDEFWKKVFEFFSLKLPPPLLATTVRTELIRPYYNSGFILVNGISGFFGQWLKDFNEIMDSGIRIGTFKSRFEDDFSFMEQMVLSVTAERFNNQINLVDNRINYPIPFHPYLKSQNRHCEISELIHLHYHKWFQHPGFLNHVFNEMERKTPLYGWLKQRLPLEPTIEGPFKT